MSAAAYRMNLSEAQRELDIAKALVDEYRARDLTVWGTTSKGFCGWLVKGSKADEAYSNYHKARTDVEHWGTLLNDSLRLTSIPQDSRLPPEKDDEPMTPEQVEQRKADLNRDFLEWQARAAAAVQP